MHGVLKLKQESAGKCVSSSSSSSSSFNRRLKVASQKGRLLRRAGESRQEVSHLKGCGLMWPSICAPGPPLNVIKPCHFRLSGRQRGPLEDAPLLLGDALPFLEAVSGASAGPLPLPRPPVFQPLHLQAFSAASGDLARGRGRPERQASGCPFSFHSAGRGPSGPPPAPEQGLPPLPQGLPASACRVTAGGLLSGAPGGDAAEARSSL